MPTKTAKTTLTVIVNKRIYPRPMERSDATAMIRLTNQSARPFPGVGRRLKRKTQFEEMQQRHNHKDCFGFMICREEDGEPVGGISLFEIRQSYVTEALRLVLRFAFHQLKLHRIEANIQAHNVAPIALVKRAGFTCESSVRQFETTAKQRGGDALVAGVIPFANNFTMSKRCLVASTLLQRFQFLKIAGRWRDHERWAILAEDWRGRRRK